MSSVQLCGSVGVGKSPLSFTVLSVTYILNAKLRFPGGADLSALLQIAISSFQAVSALKRALQAQ